MFQSNSTLSTPPMNERRIRLFTFSVAIMSSSANMHAFFILNIFILFDGLPFSTSSLFQCLTALIEQILLPDLELLLKTKQKDEEKNTGTFLFMIYPIHGIHRSHDIQTYLEI